MKAFLASRLANSVVKALSHCAYFLQHLLMKLAVAVSLQLCLFTARVLLASSARRRASQSF